MKNYSKLFGAGTGVILGQLLAAFLPPEKANGIGQAAQILLPIIGTYLAPANQPPAAGPAS